MEVCLPSNFEISLNLIAPQLLEAEEGAERGGHFSELLGAKLILRQLHDGLALSQPHVDQHVSVRVVALERLDQLGSVLEVPRLKAVVTSSDALTNSMRLSHLSDFGIVELEPAIVKARPNERVVVALVKSATMHQNGVQEILVDHVAVRLTQRWPAITLMLRGL